MNEDLNTPHFTIHEASDDVWLAKHALDNNAQDGYFLYQICQTAPLVGYLVCSLI
jgi:hypothetical protein